jgi:hypothetical protein
VPEKSTTELLAAIGVRHEPLPASMTGYHGCRMLFVGDAQIGPMNVQQANALLNSAECAA